MSQLASLRHDARVGGEHARDIGIDLAGIGVERLCKRRGGEIAGATTKCGDFVLIAHTLETSNNAHLALGQGLADTVALDLDDLGLAVLVVGDDADLAAGEADCVDAKVADGHTDQCRRHALARGEQHVHLAAGAGIGDLRGQRNEVVGGLAHRADDDNNVVAVALGERDMFGNRTHAIGVGYRSTAKLLNNQGHGLDRLSVGSHDTATRLTVHAQRRTDLFGTQARYCDQPCCPPVSIPRMHPKCAGQLLRSRSQRLEPTAPTDSRRRSSPQSRAICTRRCQPWEQHSRWASSEDSQLQSWAALPPGQHGARPSAAAYWRSR